MFAFNRNPTTTNTKTSNPTTSKCRVKFDGKPIETTVTDKASTIDEWVHEILSMYDGKPMVVGLDIEWKPNSSREDDNKAATLQLCIGEKCLIVQLLHTDGIPQPLKSFLMDSNFTFVGVKVAEDIAKLNGDYGIECNKSADISELAMRQWQGRFEGGKPGLERLALEVLGVSMKKPQEVRRSNWDKRVLDENQVEYACIDAYVSYRVGHKLLVEIRGDNKLLHMLGLHTASFKSTVFRCLLFYLFFILFFEWY
ncbi:hypothetical protein FH972_016272 [Carpinus fangiana]|uniref:3'-5' exonuclease domain-containing protein n=1 Tax=Carpinus fangiana TaxID=176857 RepID=A0A5N6RIX9_9ROSI|nr:hypothetical protein FH972_016272 [Carpinus fangiana]